MTRRTITWKLLSLRPYPGEVRLFASLSDLRLHYEKHVGPYPYTDEPTGGRYIFLEPKRGQNASHGVYIVYANRPHVLAHELTHVLLHTWKRIGADPRESNGEPFCYMLSQLLVDAK